MIVQNLYRSGENVCQTSGFSLATPERTGRYPVSTPSGRFQAGSGLLRHFYMLILAS